MDRDTKAIEEIANPLEAPPCLESCGPPAAR
jgi:hypothetical protein